MNESSSQPSKTVLPTEHTPTRSTADIRGTILRDFYTPVDPEAIFKQVDVHRKEKTLNTPQGQEITNQAVITLAFENDYSLAETVNEKYRGLTIELRRQLIKDFNCTTYAEKLLVDAVVSGYMRHIAAARHFNGTLELDRVTPNLNTFFATMSKEMDRANRHMLCAYQMLVNLKRPPMKVEVKAQNAFIANNQQINAEKSHADTINPK